MRHVGSQQFGGFAPVYIAEEISNNQFKIAGGKPGMKVSWTVTGVRQDAWANAHRIPVEVDKPANGRGSYIHPELYGAAEEKGVEWGRHPKEMAESGPRDASLAGSEPQTIIARPWATKQEGHSSVESSG